MSQIPSVRRRFYYALPVYAALAVAAGLTLDGTVRIFIWILLTGLILKSWVHVRREELK